MVVDSIAVEGNERLDRTEVVGTAGIRPGEPISYRDIQRSVKDLWATGQYQDIEVFASGGETPDEPVVLRYRITERSMVRIVDIRGLERLSPGEVRDTTGLEAGQPYSPQAVERAKRYIRNGLAEEGIPFASIDVRQEPIADAPNSIRLVVDVEEGHRVAVSQVEIRGNEAFPDDDLVGSLATRPEGFWWFRDGSFNEETLAQDLRQRLPGFYRARGYLDFQVMDDTLIVDPETGKARLELEVEEGPRYRVADFTVDGNQEFSTAELRQYFDTEEGGLLQSLGFGDREESQNPVFDDVAFQEATGEVQRLYNNNGYLYAEVRPFVEKLDSTTQSGAPLVRVGWEIEEGNPAYIDRVAIEGNEYTYERVIRDKILILPGDIYSEDRLLQSYRNIQGLGFFSTPMDPPDIRPDPETGDVDITFKVEEMQTGSVNFGTAVGRGTGLSGFLGYDQPNLFGQAKQGHLRWDFGRYINSFTASYSDPAFLGSRVSSSFSVFNSQDRFFSFQTGERRRLGASARFGIPLPWSRFTRFFVGYSLSRTKYRLREGVDDRSLFGRPPGTQSTVSLGVTRTTLNHPIFPTQGSRQRVNFELNGGLLGGDGDFVKQTIDGSWWIPVASVGGGAPGSRGVQFALGLSAAAGAVHGNAEAFPFDRFWMGGVQFGQQLRGYDETSVTPLGHVPERSGAIAAIDRLGDSYLRMTAEYAVRLNDNISASLFYEAGNVWSDPFAMNPAHLRRGAGFGVQLVTPFGPIGLDYAYGFDKAEPGWQLHFRMGPGF